MLLPRRRYRAASIVMSFDTPVARDYSSGQVINLFSSGRLIMRKNNALGWLLTLCLLPCGCNSALETGYKPRRLGASPAERRAYYASPFTPEAHAAQQERREEFNQRRPQPGL